MNEKQETPAANVYKTSKTTWILIGFMVLILAIIIFMMMRKKKDGEGGGVTESIAPSM